ncbi:MAG TPA: amidohydrolase family protein, partial [Chitinophagaceae bacterium]|nr:amidohydrolase family protein [Chitinophagaceae bacterium]
PLPSFIPSSRSSLQTYLPYYTNGQTVILVHNTFIDEEDILFAKQHAEEYGLTLYYCLCPNANLYIEDRLPPVDLLLKHNCSIILGTDSYASNKELSITSEIATLAANFPELSLSHLLQWATSNSAKAFGGDYLGSFQTGKKPGFVSLATSGDKITGTSRRIM